MRIGLKRWMAATAAMIAVAALAVACGEEVIETGQSDPPVAQPPALMAVQPPSGTRLTPACQVSSTRLYPYAVSGKCVEIWGPGLTIDVTTPATTYQYTCVGFGQAPNVAPYFGEWDQVFQNGFNIPTGKWDYEFHWSLGGSMIMESADTFNYVMNVKPIYGGAGQSLSCSIDAGSKSISIDVHGPTGPGRYLKTITNIGANPSNTIRAGSTTTYSVDGYKDNAGNSTPPYPGVIPTPTYTWTSLQPQYATVNPTTGVVTGVSRGNATIRATAQNGVYGQKWVYIRDCYAVTPSSTSDITLPYAQSTSLSVTLSCDTDIINPSTDPVTWQTSNASIATVTGGGTGNHTGTITATGMGLTTIRACANGVSSQVCSQWINVQVNRYSTQITSALDGTTITTGPNTSGTIPFSIQNTGNIQGTSSLTCSQLGSVTCLGVSPSGFTLAPGQTGNGTISWSTGATTGWGNIRITASPYGTSDAWGFSVAGGPFTVSINYGPDAVQSRVNCEWMANVNGGVAPFTWDTWTVDGVPVSGSDNDLYYVNRGSDFTLGISVTDANGTVATASRPITVSGSAPYCPL